MSSRLAPAPARIRPARPRPRVATLLVAGLLAILGAGIGGVVAPGPAVAGAPAPVDDSPDPIDDSPESDGGEPGPDEPDEPPPAVEEPPPQPPRPTSPRFTDAEYWAFADRVVARLRNSWSPGNRTYRPTLLKHNAELLTLHALAALHGHRGAARNDERARLLIDRFLASPPWSDGQFGLRNALWHAPGWTNKFDNPRGGMGKVVDAKAAEALMYAWEARFVLELPPDTVALIVDRITRAAYASFYRYPSAVLNQINFNSELYEAVGAVGAGGGLLRRDYRLQLRRFAREIKVPRQSASVLASGNTRKLGPGAALATNLGPSYRFHYWPGVPISRRQNLDSPEYANLVVDVLRHYPIARAAGAPKLSSDHMRLLRAWVTRILAGYWTHAGYLNWDTGHGMSRWHRGIFWALAQQGLLTIAQTRHFQQRREIGLWAKWMFDRGLLFYLDLVDAEQFPKLPSASMFGIGAEPRVLDTWALGARMASNAARAVHYGLGRAPSAKPPPLYAYDADIGRVAVTTPTYSTAIVAVTQQAFPYGGVELARLYDRNGRIAATAGGTGDAAFGLVVRNVLGDRALATQRRRGLNPVRPPVVLRRSPRGEVTTQRPYPRRPDAGAFGELVTSSTTGTRALEVETRHRFLSRSIEVNWRLSRREGTTPYVVGAQFPSWGADARATAVLHDGSRVPLSAQSGFPSPPLPVDSIAWLHLEGEGSGYVVIPVAPRGALLKAIPTRPERTNPRPGPTLVVEAPLDAETEKLELAAAISPAWSSAGARAVAGRLQPLARRLRRGLERRAERERRRQLAEQRERERRERERERREREQAEREQGERRNGGREAAR